MNAKLVPVYQKQNAGKKSQASDVNVPLGVLENVERREMAVIRKFHTLKLP